MWRSRGDWKTWWNRKLRGYCNQTYRLSPKLCLRLILIVLIVQERAETEQSIAEMCYLQGVLREQWDSWMVKSRAIKVRELSLNETFVSLLAFNDLFLSQAFHSEPIVQNYPLHERTQNELEDLRRVQNMRKLDEAECTVSKIGGLNSD